MIRTRQGPLGFCRALAGRDIVEKIRKLIKEYWITIFIFIGMVAFYIFITENDLVGAFLFPKKEAIGKAFSEHIGTLFLNMFYSFGLLIPSICASILIAMTVGTWLGLHTKVRKVLYPVIYTISVIPSILLSPFVLIMAPTFRIASLIIVVYSTIWGTLFATITGIQTIDKRYLDNAATLELHGVKKLLKVVLPAASPSILAGFVNSLRGCFTVLVYAEMYGTKYGMGFFVKKYADYGLYDKTWAGFLFLVIVLVIVMQIFERIKSYLLKWTIN